MSSSGFHRQCMHVLHVHICKQSAYTHQRIFKIFFKKDTWDYFSYVGTQIKSISKGESSIESTKLSFPLKVV